MTQIRHLFVTSLAAALLLPGCLLGGTSGTTTRECERSSCGCYDPVQLAFTGYVMDGVTHECLRGKLVRLRDRDGTVVAEDTSKSFGGYNVAGTVQRSPHCGGGGPVIREMPDGGDTPEFDYLPIETPIDPTSIKVNLLRFPFGTRDAGSGHPEACLPPRDAGM